MLRTSRVNRVGGLALLLLASCAASQPRAERLYDRIWVWATVPADRSEAMARTSDPAKFAQSDPYSKAAILGVKNTIMAGAGVPADLVWAIELSTQMAGQQRIIWELTPDGGVTEGQKSTFEYGRKIEVMRALKEKRPKQVIGIALDDMMTGVFKDSGFRAHHIAALRSQLKPEQAGLTVWGIVYAMNLEEELLPSFLEQVDVVNYWMWHTREIETLEKDLATLSLLSKGKPVVLGLYMYDYGGKRKMTREIMEQQCAKALELAKSGQVEGIAFLSIHDDQEIIPWTRDWIKSNAGQRVPPISRPSRPR